VRSGLAARALAEARRLDLALYRAAACTRTPVLDAALARLSSAADYSGISIAIALGLALAGGPRGRRAAVRGMASVGVTAAVVNLVSKPLTGRRRPDRSNSLSTPARRRVRMPASRSFPSGHTAASFAFATGAGRELPWTGPPLYTVAALVGYSRVHTGVHYPLDVVAGAICGIALGELSGAFLDRASRPEEPREWDDPYTR
jgi:membrane-associated phospholipid phosphatase